ncbi:MAG: sugar phosphate isomerase/epimerase [Peptococcaceae bacterium]|nr:sugar phosphate isomerase/epimerase [Peptococcaceae bacterium]
MEREFSLAHLTVLGCSPPEMVYIAAMAGYQHVGLRPIYMGLPGEPNYALAELPEMLSLTKAALQETGLGLNDIELARIVDGVDLERYEPAFEVSAMLGAKHVISSIWTSNKPYYIEKFGQLCELAAQYGMTVNLEFVTWAEVKNLKDACEVLQAVNCRNAGVLIDTLHAHRSRVSPHELANIPNNWIKLVHLCDGPVEIPTDRESLIFTGREARNYVGEGAIDIAAYLARLPQTVVLSLEIPNLARVKAYGYAEHARRCLVTAKEYVARRA